MKKLFLLTFLLAFAIAPLSAQTTTLTLNVTDTSSNNWSGPYTLQLVAAPGQNQNVAPPFYLSGVLMTPAQMTLTGTLANGTASFPVSSTNFITPVGAVWNISVCFSSTGPCYSSVRVSITGATQTIALTPPAPTSGGGGSGTVVSAPLNSVEASFNCPSGGTLTCKPVYDDGRFVTDATTVNTSSTITCPDCNFSTTGGEAGKYAWVGVVQSGTTPTCPISTFTVNSVTSITLTAANDCTASLTGTATLWWGHKDTLSGSDNLAAAFLAAGCGDLKLPTLSANPPSANQTGAFMFVDRAEFNTLPSAMCGGPLAAPFNSPGLEGGIGQTFLVMTPDFVWSTCPAVAAISMNVCFGVSEINTRGVFIESAGMQSSPASLTAVFAELGGRAESVNIAVSAPTNTNLIDYEWSGAATHISQGGAQGGGVACEVDNNSGAPGFVYSYATFCTPSGAQTGNTCMKINTNASLVGVGDFFYLNTCLTTVASGAFFNSQSDTIWDLADSGSFVGTGSILQGGGATSQNVAAKLLASGANFSCNGCQINPTATASGQAGVWASVSGSIASLQNTRVWNGSATAGNPLVVTGTGQFIDEGGNVPPSNGVVLVQTNTALVQPGAANGFTANCTGVASSTSVLGLYGTGPNATTITCTSTTIGTGILVQGSGHTLYSLICTSSATTVSVPCTVWRSTGGGASAATTSTCTMTAATFCQDGTHQVALSNGDYITIKIGTTGTSETGANITATVVWN